MTDALEYLEASLERIATAKEARQLGAILERVNERTKDVARSGQRCQALVEMVITLDGLSEPQKLDAAKVAIQAVADTGKLLATAASVDDLEDILESLNELAGALQRFDLSVRQVWADRARTDYASLIPVGELLRQISGAENLGQRLEEIGAKAHRLVDQSQTATVMASEIAALQADRTELLALLNAFTADPEVELFISAVTKGQATLELVTTTVLQWLSDHGALRAFKVSG